MSRVLQLLSTVYAVAMLVITVGVYTRNEQHPGLALFFVSCLASFYIICYNALSIEETFKLWLERHYPSMRQLSLAVAVVLATVPIGVLYVMQPKNAVSPTSVQAAKESLVTASPAATAAKDQAGESGGAEVIAVLTDIRHWSGPAATTVAIDVDEKVQYEVHRLSSPHRIYLDLRGSKLDRALWGRRFVMKDPRLRAIRVAEHEEHFTRVTLETDSFCDYTVTPQPNAHGLLIELRNWPGQS